MKVRELKVLLNNFNDEDLVIIQKDTEGNGYSPLDYIWEGSYKPYYEWCGEVYIRELTPELVKHGYSEEDVCEDGENCIVLCPMN